MNNVEIDKLDEPLWGVENFAKVINRTPRQVYHMINAGHLPGVTKKGERYVSTRRKLLEAVLGDAT